MYGHRNTELEMPNRPKTIPASAIISTRRFERSHMRLPRGRGCWLFETRNGTVVVQHTGTYGEAKKFAAGWARANGCDELWVCP